MATGGEDDKVVQYLIHPALRPALDEWLHQRGLMVLRLPRDIEGENSLPTYFTTPTEEAMRRVRRE